MHMTKSDIMELRRRFQKNQCTFDRMSGCYVSASGQVLLKFQEYFMDLEEDEFYKYLEIAKKVMSGTIGNNLLELEFDRKETDEDSHQSFLLALKSSKLENEDLLDRFYEQVMAHYHGENNYLILVFHDIYDVITKTKDRAKLDESSEVYEYLLCAICPVELSKAGLGYRQAENRIGCRERDWVVGQPELGFVYPAFCERSCDVNRFLYYVRNAKDPQPEFMEEALGCQSRRTAAEEKQAFRILVEDAYAANPEEGDQAFLRMQKNLSEISREAEAELLPPVQLTEQTMDQVMEDAAIPQEMRDHLRQSCRMRFGEIPAQVDHLIDEKAVEENARREQTLRLENQISALEQQLADKQADLPPWETPGIQVHMPPEKAEQITVQIVDGQKFLLIPIEDDQKAWVNGQEKKMQ